MKTSKKVEKLRQSNIRAASKRCAEVGGINLGQGVCEVPTPTLIKEAAAKAINGDHNTYSPYEGISLLRQAITKKLKQFNKINMDNGLDVMVTHGSTGAYVAAVISLFDPGDEVILFEPFYGYHKGILELNGIKVKTTKVSLEDFKIDFNDLKKLITDKTRGIIVCTPCNPSGKVFTKEELLEIGKLAKQHDLVVITDEIYEYITYPGHEHVSLASLEDHAERTITLSGFSKTYNMTGWRLGYAAGPAEVIHKMALVHDLLYICPPTPLQYAVLAAFELDQKYYDEMNQKYLEKRDKMVNALREMGFKVVMPQGAYYLLVDFSHLGYENDEIAAAKVLEKAKVALVAGGAFYNNPEDGKNLLRLCYAMDDNKLDLAIRQLRAII